jgi:hypothetical protein
MTLLGEASAGPVVRVRHDEQLLAVIVRSDFREPGITFFTEDELSQQMGFMRHLAGKVIEPHLHNHISRSVNYTQEALFIRRGKIRVDFYSDAQHYLFSYVLQTGDVVLLISGGHGFEVLEEVEMIEIKQGPYAGDRDKTRFTAIRSEQLCGPDGGKADLGSPTTSVARR